MKRCIKRVLLLVLAVVMLLSSSGPVSAAPVNGWNKAKTLYYRNGKKYTGQKKVDGKYYLFKDGKPQKGFQTIRWKGEKIRVYFSKKTGEKLFGKRKIKGEWYYFEKKSGKMKTGWLKTGGKRYYYDQEGHLIRGLYAGKKGVYSFDYDDGALLIKITKEKAKKAAGKSKKGTKTYMLMGLSEEEIIEKLGPLFTADQKKTGILASVSMAQFILESWYGRSELALMSQNCFGMKEVISGNTWPGSTWNGHSVYKKKTGEEDENGRQYTITARFRKYKSIEESIADHSAYLLHARNESGKLRYAGVKNCKSYKKAAKIIKKGGYATSSSYVSELCEVIERWNLTRFNA